MPVFDFSSTPENEKKQDPICTYTTFRSNEGSASAEKPILILDNSSEKWNHHAVGVFGNQSKRTNFELKVYYATPLKNRLNLKMKKKPSSPIFSRLMPVLSV